jgi:anti-sigma-K factor RskA
MTEGRDHSWYEELVPAYALGVADEVESLAMDAHLKECPPCRLHVKEYEELGDALLYTAPPHQARVGLNEDFRKRLQSTASSTPFRSLWTSLWRPGSALALVALVLLVLTNVYWGGRAASAERDMATLARLTQAPGVVLDVSTGVSYASGIVYAESSATVALLCVYRLPNLEPGKTYQAWLIQDDERVSAGTFEVNQEGYGVLIIQSDAPLGEFDGLGITVEPAGGSPAPTTPRVMGGTL